MNIYGWIIFITLVAKFLIDLISQWLNLHSLDPHVPDAFENLYDAEKYAKSQEYTRVTTRFHQLETAFHLLPLLAFWFSGGFNWLDHHVRAIGFGPIRTGLLYIGVLALGGAILSFPFSL